MLKKLVNNLLTTARRTGFQRQSAEIARIKTETDREAFERSALQALLGHAYLQVPYYRDILGAAGLIKGTEIDLTLFDRLPLLTKDIIRQQKDRLHSADKDRRGCFLNSSGGSTGEPVKLLQDADYLKWGDAANLFWYRSILGIDYQNARKVVLWGSARDLLAGGSGWGARFYNWRTGTLFLNSFKMSPADMARFIETINRFRPHIIRGYADSLVELCKFARQNTLTVFSPNLVVSSANLLTREKREIIQQVMRTRVFDFYGSREASNLAGECDCGLLQVFSFHNLVEILDDNNRPAAENQPGKVVVTNLHNYSMPLIRYAIGDIAVRGPQRCQCGHFLPTLKNITGRVSDNFRKKDGTLIYPGFFNSLFYLKDWVRSYQIEQEGYLKVTVRVVLNDTVNPVEKEDIENKMKFVLDTGCEINWQWVDEIPPTPNGKHQYTISRIKTD